MNKPEEIKFLMDFYEKLKTIHKNLSKIELDKKFDEQVKKLIKDDDISQSAYDMVKSIYEIKITSLSSSRTERTTDTNSSTKTTSMKTSSVSPPREVYSDPCSHGYSGSRRGGC